MSKKMIVSMASRRTPRRLMFAVLLTALLLPAGPAAAQLGCDGAAPPADPALACAVDADTTDPLVIAKAQSLGNDIDAILDFVRSQVRFESYTGSLRGARGTLWSGAGNALDKANLAVALLRSSGIRARYVRGTLNPAQSALLIDSMFPVVTRVVGCPPPGTERSHPSSDPALLAEVADHFWIEVERNSAFEAVDLAMPDAPATGDVGQRLAVFTSVPDELRHFVTLRLVVELSGTGLANGRRTLDVLEERFAAAELVGKPATFGHYQVQSTPGGLFGAGILTYQPYLLIDGEPTGQGQLFLPGDEYQEVHLGVMNEFVSLLAVQFDLEAPGGAIERHERAIIDRLGPELREGFVTTTIIPPAGLEPTVTEFDQLTVNVLPGLQAPEPIAAQEARVTPIADEFSAILPELEAIGMNGVNTPEDEILVRRGSELAAEIIRLASQALVLSMAGASDRVMAQLDPGLLTRGYFDSPRLIVALSQYSDEGVALKLDLRRTSARAIPYPDQIADQAANYEFVRGLIDSATETELMRSVTTGPVHSATAIFEAAPDGVGVEDIAPGEAWKLDSLAISGDAKARIRAALAEGDSVIVPEAMIPFDGGSHIAWFEVDAATGYAIGVTEDGGHQAAIGYGLLTKKISDAGVLVPAFSNGFTAGILGFLGSFIEEYSNGATFEQAVRAAKAHVAQMAKQITSMFKKNAKRGLQAGFATAKWWINHAIPVDPPVQDFLATPFDPIVAPAVSGGALDVAVRRDEMFYIDIDGAELPTVYRASLRNAGATTESFDIEFDSDAPGFTVVASASQLTLAPGEVGEVGVCLFPISGVPPVGDLGDVSVSATSVGNPSDTAEDSEEVVAPEVHGMTVEVTPGAVSGAPGTSVEFQLIVTASGNVGETAPTIVDAPAGWIVSGVPASLTLAAGEVRIIEGSVVIPADASSGDAVTITLGADPCGSVAPEDCTLDTPSERTGTLSIDVRSAAVAAITNAGNCAAAETQGVLAAALSAVADSANTYEQVPGAAACQGLRQRMAALCPILATVSSLSSVQAALCPANVNAPCDGNTVAGIQSALTPLCDALAYRIEATLVPTTTYAAPGVSAPALLRLRGLGSGDATVDVAIEQAAAGLGITGAPVQVAVASGATVDVPLSLVAADAGSYGFSVSATPQESPAAARTVHGAHRATTSVLNILQVIGSPPYIFTNGTTQIRATVANVVGSPVTARAHVTIGHPDNSVQYESAAPLLVTIPGGGSLDLALDFVTATGWDNEVYSVEVTFTALDGSAIPGGSGTGQLPVGQPLRASVFADPILVAPGTSEVTSTVEVDSTLDAIGGPGSVPPTDPTLNRIDWAAASRGASLSGPSTDSNALIGILIDELGSGAEAYVGNHWTAGHTFVLDLGQTRSFDTVQVHLYDGDDRYYRYLIEVSEDGVNYTSVADATTGEWRGIERHVFSPVSARYVRIGGTGSSLGATFHLIDEILVIGDEPTTAMATSVVDVHGIDDGGVSFTVGDSLALHAGTYVVTHVGGAVSHYASDADLGGKSWFVNLRVDVPVANKSYTIGHIHNALTTYATSASAETANLGRAFKLYMPVDGVAYFWTPDNAPGDNRGSQQFEVRQVSGPDDGLTARMRDAIMRGALWEQPAIAAWQSWVSAADYGCMGCHEQTQASVGIEVSRRKVPDTPVDERLHRAFIDGYKTWQDAEGFVSPQHGGQFAITQTSLWAWAVSQFRGTDSDELAPPLVRALDWLLGVQRPDGGWVADNADGNSAKLYFDGDPSATQTAAVIQALARGVDLVEGRDLVPYVDVTISDNRVVWTRNPGFNADILLEPADGVTGVRLTIADAFSNDGNFVLGEIEFFDGDTLIPVISAVADFSQGNYGIEETFDGIKNDVNNGWAHSPQQLSPGNTAEAVWIFAAPARVDRIRLNQPYRLSHERGRGLQFEDLTVDATTAAVPTLASSFAPIDVTETGIDVGTREATYTESIRRAAAMFAAPTFDYMRNTRTGAQTVIGLQAALPFLQGADLSNAQARLDAAAEWLRSTQLTDGGWNDGAGVSRVFQTAQALEALVETSDSTVDAAIVAGAEYLLTTQRPDGRWLSPPLAADTPGATTWVQIALPALFENLSGLTLDVSHRVRTTGNPIVEGSIVPGEEDRITTAGQEEIHWTSVLIGADTSRSFEVRTRVTDMLPGETRQISNGTTVDFDSIAGAGQIELPVLTVAARHIITIAPGSITQPPGGVADYVVSVENVRASQDTFTLSIDGIDPSLVSMDTEVVVPAGQIVQVPMQVAVPLDTPESDIELLVSGVSTAGSEDSAGAFLLVRGEAAPVETTPVRAVHVALVPSDLAVGRGMTVTTAVRITNLGDAPETYDLSGVLPSGIDGVFEPASIEVLPGVGNSIDVALHLSAPDDAAPAENLPFAVRATSQSDALVFADAAGTLDVLGLGVQVTLTPTAGPTGSTFTLHVRNTGLASDGFTLALSGPLAGGADPVAVLAQTSVPALATGAEIAISVDVGAAPFAVVGSIPLTAIATSTTDARITAEDTAQVDIGVTREIELSLAPECQEPAGAAGVGYALQMLNLGNIEEEFDLSVIGTTGDVGAQLMSPEGTMVTTLSGIRLPGLAGALAGVHATGTNGTFTIALQGEAAIAGSVTGRVDCDIVVTTTTTTTTTTSTTSTTLPELACAFDAARGISMKKQTRSYGDLGVNGVPGKMKFGKEAEMLGSTVATADRLKAGKDVHLQNVAANTTKLAPSVVIDGVQTTADLPIADPFCPVMLTDCGRNDVDVRTNSETLAPGDYGKLTLASDSRLTLQAGEYRFCSISGARGAELAVGDGEVIVRVVDGVKMGSESVIGDEDHLLRLEVSGSPVKFGKDVEVHASISAPAAKFAIGRESQLFGDACAFRLVVGAGSELRCQAPPE